MIKKPYFSTLVIFKFKRGFFFLLSVQFQVSYDRHGVSPTVEKQKRHHVDSRKTQLGHVQENLGSDWLIVCFGLVYQI